MHSVSCLVPSIATSILILEYSEILYNEIILQYQSKNNCKDKWKLLNEINDHLSNLIQYTKTIKILKFKELLKCLTDSIMYLLNNCYNYYKTYNYLHKKIIVSSDTKYY